MKPFGAVWRLALTGVIVGLLFILVTNVIRQPVAADQRSYAAEFTDASGLHRDADVRVRGVRVGKVKSVELERRNGQSLAVVHFQLDTRFGVVSDTRLAIKYQALTGLRYVDVVNPGEPYSDADLVTRAPTSMTQPSIDITALFNGLQPVLATLSPAEINTFTANAVSYLSGDGSGLAPMLDSVRKLTEFVANRQQVIATLMRNLSAIAETIGGHSKDMIQILEWVNRPLDGGLDAIDEFRKSQLYGPEFVESVVRLLTNAGLPPEGNSGLRFIIGTQPNDRLDSDIDAAMDRAFSNIDDYFDAFKLVPAYWENIPEPAAEGHALPCSQGRFELPAPMDVLVNGQKVVLCNR